MSYRAEDDRLKLGRLTDWKDLGGGFTQGVGQHVFQVGDDEYGMLEIREAAFTYSGAETQNGN
jgi:type VI secretion system protein ImpE